MERVMNSFIFVWWIIGGVAILAIFLYGLYLLARIYVPKLAENDTFFSSPKLGRIKARRRSGRIVQFIDNLVGKNKHVNPDTGKIEPGEIRPTGFWWDRFGVHFIGLDDIYEYKIATEATEGDDGQLKYKEDQASSIFLEGSHLIAAILLTKDGVRLRVKLQLKLTTLDAAKALSLPISWTIPVFAAVLGASRDFFGAREAGELISAQNEGDKVSVNTQVIANSGFVELIRNLNTSTGNLSLAEICGQHIDAVNVVDIDFADKATEEAFWAPFVAEEEAQKQIKDAEAYAQAVKIKSEADLAAAKNIAAAILEKGEAEAKVYGQKHTAMGGKDAQATSEVLVAEKQGTLDKLTTHVRGGPTVTATPTK
jgi:regulator of protease activity HflC (stomatin/prohibitin superfamily)